LLWWAGALLAVVVAGLVGFGLNSAEAKTPSPSASPGVAAPVGRPGPWAGPWGGRGPGPGGLFDVGGALHGEVVVAKDGGGTETVLIQRGDVVEVSSSSITVKSADGFTRQYAVNGDTKVNGGRDAIGSVAVGDTVVVCAVVGGEHPAARSVIELAGR